MIVYDLGPKPPLLPKRPACLDEPELPPGSVNGPAHHEPEIARYRAEMASYAQSYANFERECTAWVAQHGDAAAEICMPDILAREALERDPRRYVRRLPAGVQLGPCSGGNRIIQC
jgi:hypothetical protein